MDRLSPSEARQLQEQLAGRVVLRPLPAVFSVLGAADLSYIKETNQLIAVIVTFSWPTLQPLESVHVKSAIRFPYVPGLLSFREIPAMLKAYAQLRRPPDIFLCDGQGLAHPRRFGLACHLGILLEKPTVGCAKTRLCGNHEPLEAERGARQPLWLDGTQVGYVYRSKTGVKPLYISPGHLADCNSALWLVERCLGRYRLPEPLRAAHHTATRLRKTMMAT
ncbi:deoxyribonuclease V [Desulfosoma caldarium]|uniref:Endonuclease V n=1 Tax=Desulfosoma caldarium TaxID=610254 RepID=A0A3N1VFZ9_9BACT|nr:deoxyribonuclease V [Desulfosoma caldarium]ROR01764.1 endonuclease V [Desulfosoma caldarium]